MRTVLVITGIAVLAVASSARGPITAAVGRRANAVTSSMGRSQYADAGWGLLQYDSRHGSCTR